MLCDGAKRGRRQSCKVLKLLIQETRSNDSTVRVSTVMKKQTVNDEAGTECTTTAKSIQYVLGCHAVCECSQRMAAAHPPPNTES